MPDLSYKAYLTVREGGKYGLHVSPGGKGKSLGEQLARIIINKKGVRIEKKVRINKPELGGDEKEGLVEILPLNKREKNSSETEEKQCKC